MTTSARTTAYSIGLILFNALACGSSGDDDAASSASGGQGGTTAATGGTDSSNAGADGGTVTNGGSNASGGSGAKGGSSSGKGGTTASGGSSGTKGGSSGSSGSGGGPLPVVPGEPCNSVDSALPPKPCMTNVSATVSGNAADIHYDPIDGAADYRVYELPADGDITAKGDTLTIKNAVYRCAGTRQSVAVLSDSEPDKQGAAVRTLVDGVDVGGYKRSLDEATLGYVSAVPGDGLVPVYALGDSDKRADNQCGSMRWAESRTKQYVTSTSERDKLLKQSFRDDGIVFYVPSSDATGTKPVYLSVDASQPDYTSRYYFVDGPEASARKGATTAFSVFSDPADGLVPLMRVFYRNGCGFSHDELMAGKARFDRAYKQGDTSPMTDLHWSGLSGETTLVVEALADGCPNLPGLLAPVSDPTWTDDYGNPRPAWISLDDAKGLSSSGELYVNGQFDPKNQPRPIARSFVKVKPAAAPKLDWFQGFDDPDLGKMTEEDCGNPTNCNSEYRMAASFGDVHFISVEPRRHVLQSVLGELWVMYDDVAADTPGKFRITAGDSATIADDTFVYATMEVSSFTTTRRYPQILISDQQAPVHWNMAKGQTVIIQTFQDWPYRFEVEVCDHRPWDVNNQCPRVDLYHYGTDSAGDFDSIAPNAEVGEHTGVDRSTHLEAWVSSKRAYLYLDGEPYGCVDLPAGAPQAGPATVTFGDTLYHSGVDNIGEFSYMKNNFQYDMRRHYDNLGFKSGVDAPSWDESRFPCQSTFLE